MAGIKSWVNGRDRRAVSFAFACGHGSAVSCRLIGRLVYAIAGISELNPASMHTEFATSRTELDRDGRNHEQADER
jgi:hypothetical protein